ncbi:zinc finger protein 888-like [Folsomia candida]|uniref:zinc finger protein 888-like n=1 Tax=Folsomia candida TaxID=158441 RepID=UPI00160555B4|nr:zinc finger protein 888-like [Folsomia candida]
MPLKSNARHCEICGKMLKNPVTLAAHVSHMHTNRIRLSCNICNDTFSNRGHLQRHMDTVHPTKEQPRFPCGFPGCEKSFNRKDGVSKHVKSTHMQKVGRETFKCQLCPQTRTSRERLQNHIRRVHENQRNYPCTFCDKRFSNSYHLKRHVEVIHATNKEPIHSCDKCGYKSHSKHYLTMHARRHNAGRHGS